MSIKQTENVLLAIFAHPDDESYRMGGLLTLLAQRGVRVHVVTATRGESGSTGQPGICTPEQLPHIREKELCCACQVLQLQPPHILGYPDGHLAESDPEQIIQQILLIMEEIQPHVVFSFGPDGLSGHSDHIAIGNFSSEAFQRYHKAGVLYHLAIPISVAQALGMNQLKPVADSQISLAIDVTSAWDMKMRAICCHATQVASSPILSQSEDRQRKFLGVEHFVRALTLNPRLDFVPALLKEHIL
jgi:LmbE family N-acetylglucosaminyl deacetylase